MATREELAALDLTALVGRSVDEARRIVEAVGGRVRVVAPHQPVTLEYREDRVTLIVVDDVVRDVTGIG
jgi:hypothetical protein